MVSNDSVGYRLAACSTVKPWQMPLLVKNCFHPPAAVNILVTAFRGRRGRHPARHLACQAAR